MRSTEDFFIFFILFIIIIIIFFVFFFFGGHSISWAKSDAHVHTSQIKRI